MKRKKCLFLIPTSYNDGREVPAEVMDGLLEELYLNFGGYSIAGIAEGTWRMKDGTKASDSSLQVWVIMEEEKVPLMRDLIKKFARILGQEKMLFEAMDWPGEFIGPD
jgi:hypothetical protein